MFFAVMEKFTSKKTPLPYIKYFPARTKKELREHIFASRSGKMPVPQKPAERSVPPAQASPFKKEDILTCPSKIYFDGHFSSTYFAK